MQSADDEDWPPQHHLLPRVSVRVTKSFNSRRGAATEGGRPDRAAQRLWDALHAARRKPVDAVASLDLEDEIYAYYLPLARSVCVVHPSARVDAGAAQQAADIGLMQAVQEWRHKDSTGFARFARDRINAQLGHLHAGQLDILTSSSRHPSRSRPPL